MPYTMVELLFPNKELVLKQVGNVYFFIPKEYVVSGNIISKNEIDLLKN